MIELVIAACLATGDCRDFSLLYDPYEVSLMTCMIAGQPEVARWQAAKPDWQVRRWHCGLQETRSAGI
jgi:hypothetical protein